MRSLEQKNAIAVPSPPGVASCVIVRVKPGRRAEDATAGEGATEQMLEERSLRRAIARRATPPSQNARQNDKLQQQQ